MNASASASGMPIKSERKIREYAPCGPTFVAGAGQLLAPTAERGCRKWLFLGFQLPNFFAKEVDVRQITHGAHQLPRIDRADPPDHSRGQVLFDAFGRCRCGGAQESGLELLAMGAVVDPIPPLP